MRRVFVVAVLLGVWATLALADPQNLANGALITHCMDWGRYYQPTCMTYFQYVPISDCDDQNATMTEGMHAWFVVAAFEEDKEWCGIQFGFSDYDPDAFAIYDCAPCTPGTSWEIPSAGWPGPLEGTAFMTMGTHWTGNYLPVYWFYGYAYDYTHGVTVMQLIPDPTVPEPFGGFSNCATPPQMFDAALGGMGVNCPGVEVCWGWQEFVCCVGTGCVLVHGEEECTALGGVLHPEWDSCGPPNPCDVTPTLGATWGSIKVMYR